MPHLVASWAQPLPLSTSIQRQVARLRRREKMVLLLMMAGDAAAAMVKSLPPSRC